MGTREASPAQDETLRNDKTIIGALQTPEAAKNNVGPALSSANKNIINI